MLVEPADTVYLLPARTRYEQEGGGTETTTERRVVFNPHIPGHQVGEARSEWRMLLDLARAVRPEAYDQLGIEDADAIRADIERSVPAYAGIAGLQRQGDQFQWGGPHLCADRSFPTEDGKAHFACVTPPAAELDPDVFTLATRRGKQFNSMIQAEVDHLTGAARDHLFIAHADAERLGLRADDPIRVTSEHGTFDGRVFLAEVTPGTIQGHWPETNALLAANRIDAEGGVPDYNARVRVARR